MAAAAAPAPITALTLLYAGFTQEKIGAAETIQQHVGGPTYTYNTEQLGINMDIWNAYTAANAGEFTEFQNANPYLNNNASIATVISTLPSWTEPWTSYEEYNNYWQVINNQDNNPFQGQGFVANAIGLNANDIVEQPRTPSTPPSSILSPPSKFNRAPSPGGGKTKSLKKRTKSLFKKKRTKKRRRKSTKRRSRR